ncbi:MAG TPA: hypothetical protein VFK03_02945 [Candidatus Saccharimonadales bacterium]|nr:hypothetical protein [Candidatus Saccharimonadales bacterium]
MAGFYPDPPANRFAYQLDGTKAYFQASDNTLTELTAAQLTTLNDESTSLIAADASIALIFIFPELRNLNAYFISGDSYWQQAITPTAMDVSADTTNGLDGVWTNLENPWTRASDQVVPVYRQQINSVSSGLVRAVRFKYTSDPPGNIRAVNLYGTIPPSENPDRLVFWEPVNDQVMLDSFMDWGDISRGTTKVKQFRLKNYSSSKTANNISISSGVTTFNMAVGFSTDGTTFTSTINIASLGPGTTSSVLYIRRNVPVDEPLQVQAAYLRATAASWS